MIVQGTTGIGKSYLIGGISKYLKQVVMPNYSPLLPLAPTWVATFNIGGSTIHSKFKIWVKGFMQLEGTCLTSFHQEVIHMKYILIDEMSSIGEKLLENIDSTLH